MMAAVPFGAAAFLCARRTEVVRSSVVFGGRQVGDGGAPSACVRRLVVGRNERVVVQDAAHLPAERAGALAVNDAHLRKALFVTGPQVFGHEAAHVRRIEDVQVQLAVDGIFLHGGGAGQVEQLVNEVRGSVTRLCVCVKTQ